MMVATIIMTVISFPAGLYAVFWTKLSSTASPSNVISGLNLDLVFATVLIPIPGNLGSFFIASTAIYFVFLVLVARQGAGAVGALRASLPNRLDALFTNPLTAMIVLLGATSFVTQLLDSLQTSAGIATGSLTGDPFYLFVDFTLAPLVEETTFRLIMIGLPITLLAIVIFRGSALAGAARALWRPSSLWDVEDEGEEARTFKEAGPSLFPKSQHESLKVKAIKPIVLVFLALSSLAFGYGHYASQSGWDLGKISEATVAGLALGYLYIKYGFAANVLLHWSINYVGSVFSFLALGVYGIPWNSNTGSLFDIVPTLLLVYLLGIPSTFLVVRELIGTRSARPAPA